jgi:hypothetical protein
VPVAIETPACPWWVSLRAGVPAGLVMDDGTELVCCCDRECMGARERLRV